MCALRVQNALKYMSKQKSGRIINVTSVVGLVGNAGQVRAILVLGRAVCGAWGSKGWPGACVPPAGRLR